MSELRSNSQGGGSAGWALSAMTVLLLGAVGAAGFAFWQGTRGAVPAGDAVAQFDSAGEADSNRSPRGESDPASERVDPFAADRNEASDSAIQQTAAEADADDTDNPKPAAKGDPRNQPGKADGGKSGKAKPDKADPDDKNEEPAVEYPLRNRLPVPENIFEGGKGWLNTSGDIRLKDLKGKIVVLDFWTYCCINCMHVLPDLAFLEKKYPNEIVVIGVHSAKFDNEKDSENIRRAVQRYNIEHPVVNDAEMLIWRKFGVNAWPTLLIVDAEGNACFATSGEGKRELLDLVVSKLIEYHAATKTLDRTPLRFDLEREKMPPKPLKFPGKVLADEASGRLFTADTNHNRIVVSDLDGKLIDVVGAGGIGAKDGPFAEATFDHPQGMALSGDLLYVADTENHTLRVIDLKAKTVSTLAGTGQQDRERTPGGKLKETPLNSPWDLLIHDGSLYVAMAGPHQIWKHKLGSDSIEIYAGSGREDVRNGSLEESAFAQPSGLASDGKFLYVADSEGSAVRAVPFDVTEKVTTVVGTSNLPRGQSLFAFGDTDGVGDEARLQHCIGVAFIGGKLYIADSYNHKIKRVELTEDGGDSKTWLGDTKPGDSLDPPRFNEPHGLSAAKGKLYIADTNNHRVCVADLESGKVSVLEIAGLQPPVVKKTTADEPASKTVLEAKPQVVAAGETLTLEFAVTFPEGYKLNPMGAVTARLKSADEQPLVAAADLDKRHAVKVEDDRLRVTIPATGKPGAATFEVTLSLTYCREGSGGVCKLATLRWKTPIETKADAENKTLKLDGKVE